MSKWVVRSAFGLIESDNTQFLWHQKVRIITTVDLPADGPLTAEKGSKESMAKFNKAGIHARGSGPLTTAPVVSGVTHEGGSGYSRESKTELFLRATCNFAGEGSFYEKAAVKDERLRQLVTDLATTPEGWEWVQGFLPWLRGNGNIRSASILLAAEAVRARLAKGLHGEGNRALINAVQQRADEPGEVIAYWMSNYGRSIPKPIKRGVADAATRLYNQRSYLRQDKSAASVRFADVMDLTRPTMKIPDEKMTSLSADDRVWRIAQTNALCNWIITDRHNREGAFPPPILNMIRARKILSGYEPDRRHEFARSVLDGDEQNANMLRNALAGQWEFLLSWLGEGSPKNTLTKAQQWQLMIPHIQYMALIRNLRNLDNAGISDELAETLIKKIADKSEVENSRQLPFRFWTAYREAPSLRWGYALEKALTYSTQNIPELSGRSLILIDTSRSMLDTMSDKSRMSRVEAAALFALSLAIKNPESTDVYGFADGNFLVTGVQRGLSVLKAVEAFIRCVGNVGHGTRIWGNVRATYKKDHYARVIIFTDCQSHDSYSASIVGSEVPVYTFNLSGYSRASMPAMTGNRHSLGGLTEATFNLIKVIEAGKSGNWPWLSK